jgi:phenylacetate-CoA ligase
MLQHALDALAGLDRQGAEAQQRAQDALLKEQVRRASRSPHYRQALAEAGVDPQRFGGLQELSRLPITDKAAMAGGSDRFLAVERGQVADWCLTSATTGSQPTALAQTRADLARLASNEAGAFALAGVRPGETLLVAAALDRCFMAGLAYWLGAVKLGASAVRSGAASPAQLLDLVGKVRPQVIVGVPSLMRKAAEQARAQGGDASRLGVRLLIGIGEPLRGAALEPLPATRLLEALWGAQALSTYASTEMATSFIECPQACGAHLRPELAIVEVLDEAGQPLPAGEMGEVVATPLGVEGMPLLRFRTGDLACLIPGPCACGRSGPRLSPVLGRKNQMLKVKGTTLFPGSILAALTAIEGVSGGLVEARRDPVDGCDSVVVVAGLKPGGPSAPQVQERLRASLRINLAVRAVASDELERQANPPDKRKRLTFIDLR